MLKLRYDKTTALAIEVGMQNSGLAVTLAATNFALNPLATLVGCYFLVYGITYQVLYSLVYVEIKFHYKQKNGNIQ